MSVPLAGGVVAVVARGHDPAVSPNGRLLAYETFTDITEAPQAIVVPDLVIGTSTTWQFATHAPEISNGLAWSEPVACTGSRTLSAAPPGSLRTRSLGCARPGTRRVHRAHTWGTASTTMISLKFRPSTCQA
jgi:hypothetical protein